MNEIPSPFYPNLLKTPRINFIPRKEFETDTAPPCLQDPTSVSPSCIQFRVTTPAQPIHVSRHKPQVHVVVQHTSSKSPFDPFS
jgi:hypothetical protein